MNVAKLMNETCTYETLLFNKRKRKIWKKTHTTKKWGKQIEIFIKMLEVKQKCNEKRLKYQQS